MRHIKKFESAEGEENLKTSDTHNNTDYKIAFKVYREYTRECLDGDGDYAMTFGDWIHKKMYNFPDSF